MECSRWRSPLRQLRGAGAPVLNVDIAELALAGSGVRGFHPGVIHVELEPFVIPLSKVDLERVVEGAIPLSQRVGDGAGSRNGTEQTLARNLNVAGP